MPRWRDCIQPSRACGRAIVWRLYRLLQPRRLHLLQPGTRRQRARVGSRCFRLYVSAQSFLSAIVAIAFRSVMLLPCFWADSSTRAGATGGGEPVSGIRRSKAGGRLSINEKHLKDSAKLCPAAHVEISGPSAGGCSLLRSCTGAECVTALGCGFTSRCILRDRRALPCGISTVCGLIRRLR